MGKAGKPSADTLVPHTKGIKYGQLCNVRRKSGLVIKAGQIMAYNGAWDRKAVISHVLYMGSYDRNGYVQHVFTVGVQALGRFYATGSFIPANCPVREFQVETSNGLTGGIYMHRWVPVEPFIPPTAQQPLTMAKDGEFSQQDWHVAIVAQNGPSLDAMQAGHKAATAAYLEAHPPKYAIKQVEPEAILDQFLIKQGE